MSIYKCFVRGENFPGKLLSQKKTVGFYTTRYVTADSPAAAELAVVELLRTDKDLQVPQKHKTGAAKVFVEKITEVESAPKSYPNTGFTFFTAGT